MRTLLPRVIEHFGGVDAVVNSASLFEHDNAQSFGFAALEKHLRSNTGAPIVLAQALHQHLQQRAAAGEADAHGAVVNLLDQKLWNQNPDFLSYTLSKAALEAAGKNFELHMYEGVDHAFNNDTNAARYNEAAAKLAWDRSLAFLARHLGAPPALG